MTYEFRGIETELRTNGSDLFFKCLKEICEREELLAHCENGSKETGHGYDRNEVVKKVQYSFSGVDYHLRTYNKDIFVKHIDEIIAKEKEAGQPTKPSDRYSFHGKIYDFVTTNKALFFELMTNLLVDEKRLLEEADSSLSRNRYECFINGLWFETHNPELFFQLACEAAIGFAENATDVGPDSEKWDLNYDDPWSASRRDDKEIHDDYAWEDDTVKIKRYKKMNLIRIEFQTDKKSSDDELVVKAGFWKKDGVIEFDKDIRTPRELEEEKVFYCGGEWGNPPPTSSETMSIEEFSGEYKKIISDLMQGK